MNNYEEAKEKNIKRNDKFIKIFEKWLKEKNFTDNTIKKHISNVEFYLNEYLNYYDISKMEDGVHKLYSYLSGWFIEKCLCASKTSIKENATSIKKFYQCMSENKYIFREDYQSLCEDIKENLDECLDMLENYDHGTYYDMFI